MSSNRRVETLRGKVQYVQPTQGFIRCEKKVEKKRDIIFFIDDIPKRMRPLVRIGCSVEFHIVCDRNRKNCRGLDVTHWAQIDSVLGDSVSSDSDTVQDEAFFNRGLPPVRQVHATSHESDALASDPCFSLDSKVMRETLNELYSTVYESLYKSTLVALAKQSSPYKSCWDIYQ